MALLKTNTGIGTTNPTSALHVIGDGLFTGVVTATTFSGQINSGVGTFTNLTATNATLTNINSSGISTLGVTTVTRLTAQSINSSGIVTGSTFRPSSGYIQSPNGTNAFYIYDGTGNVAFQGTIGASQVNNASGFKVIGFAGTDITFENNAYVAGVTTSVSGFVGNLTGTATTATKLQNARTFEITGDILASPISFDGTGNVSLAATIQPNSVALGSDTTGDYVQSVSGTASQITVTGGTGEGSTPVIAIANNATLPGNVTIGNDLQINNNLNVTGNITVGGTTGYIIVNDFRVKDADIVLGFTTDSFGNDISNDTTANHGGISVASTVGTPLVQIYNPGIGESTLPTYKKIMWFQSGAFAGLNTDAWLINYAVGIGSTQFPSGTRLAAGSVQFTERDLAVVRNINASGIVTAVQFIGTASTASFATTAYNLTDAANITTGTINPARLSGTYNIDISGNAATATYATSAGVATYASSAGIATYATNAGVATYATSAGVATYASNAGVATYASASGVSTNVIGGIASVTQLSVSGISTLGIVTATQLYVSGVTTSVGGFVGNLTGTASTASFATTSSYLSDANNILSGTINVARLSGTYDININGNATTANYATNAGVATYASTAGVATYASASGVSTSVIGGIASVTQLSVSGVSTLGTVQISSGIVTSTSGIVTYYGDGSKLQGIVSVAGISVQDEGSTVGTSVTTLNFSGATISVSSAVGGISTVTVVESGIANYALVAGIATYATTAGVATYASTAGIATYATNAGIATNVIGGIASVTQLSVSGVSTFNNNVFVGSGITMYAATGIISATAFYGSGQNLSDIIAAKLAGVSIFDEGTLVGSAFQFSGLNFVGDYVAATGIGSTATITFTTPPYANVAGIATYATNAGVATNVIGGIASVTQLSVSGISTLGFVTAGNIFSTGIVTALSFVGNLTGTATTASFATTAFTLNGTSETNLSVGFARSAGIATNLRGGVAGNVPYQSAVDTTAFVSNGLSGQVLLFNGSIPIWGNVSAASGAFGGISVQDEGTPVGTANSIATLNFVSPNLSVTATSGANGIATITMSDNIVGSALSISGISTLGVTSTTNLNAQQLNVSGVSTFAGVTTHTAPLFGTQASFTGVVTASSFSGNASSATYATNAGVATYASTAGIATYATNAGVATYASTAGVATALQNARDFSITGSFVTATAISFNGTGNVALAATITPDSIGLGTYTTGDYVKNISGTSNQITVTGGTGEGSTPTLSIPNQFTAPQDVTVTRDLQVNRNLNVDGNITIGGTTAVIFSQSLNIFDPDIVLGYRTDANGNDISTDNTANHGGVAIASTEGTPLVQLFIAGIETNPATYKKIMWFKSGTFSGLNTDAWLSNYAIGIGSTQFPTGTRLAAGSVQFTENDLAVVRNINASGISTFAGITTNTSTLFANQLSVAGVSTFAGITTVTGTTLFARQLSVSGVSTIGNFRITPVGSGATVGGIGVTYFGDGSQLSNIVTGIAVTANTTNQNQLIPYTTSFGSTTGFGATSSGLVFNPSTTRLGIGTTNPLQNLHVAGNLLVAAGSATTQHITQKAYELEGGALSWEGSAGQLFSITNNLTSGSIFSVNDVSGIPSIDVNADGTVTLAPYADGNVGIATTRPTSRLHVVGNALITGVTTVGSLGIATNSSSQPLQIGSGTTIVVVDNLGDLGIGTTNPTSKLHVVGDILITGFSTLGTGATVSQTLFTNQLSVSGVSTHVGISTFQSTLFGTQLSVSGVSTFAGITTNTSTLFANQLSVSGVSTHVGISTFQSTLFGTQLSVSGVTTSAGGFVGNLTGTASTATLASYAANAGLSTNVKGTANRILYNSATDTTTTSANLTFDGTIVSVANTINVNRINPSNATQNSIIIGVGAGNTINYGNGTNGPNIIIGTRSLENQLYGGGGGQTIGFNNVIGYESLRNTTSGGGGGSQSATFNNIFGYQVAYLNTVGTSGGGGEINNAIGYQAAYKLTTGSGNNIIGYQAGYNNTTGGHNTFLGYQAGYTNVSGNYNIAIGYTAGFSVTGSNNIVIGYNRDVPTPSGSNQLVIGSNTQDWIVGDSSYNVGLGTNAPLQKLHVGGGATVTTTLFTSQLSVSGVSTFAGITTVTGTTLFARQLNVSGVSTFAGITTVTSTLFATQLNISGVSTIGNFRITPVGSGATVGGIGVTYFGDGSNLTGVSGGVSISTNTTNQNQLITYATSFGSTTGFGATSLGLVFNPSTTRLGIGTTNPQYNLHVIGDFAATSKSFVINHPTKDGKKLRYASLEGPENGVYVRGRTQDAVIELPDYWTGLIDENSITVNLTSIGDSAMPRVESIGNNVINVFSKEEGDLDYYYTVYAERKDIEKLVVEY